MGCGVECLERRQLLSGSGIHAHFAAGRAFVAGQMAYLAATADHPQSLVVGNVATVDWGDGAGPQAVAAFPFDATAAEISAPHVFARAGIYRVQVTFFNEAGVATGITRQVHVAPHSQGGKTLHAKTGAALTTLYGTFRGTPNASKVLVDFGDGMQGVGIVNEVGRGRFEVTASHTYADPGAYVVQIRRNRNLPVEAKAVGAAAPTAAGSDVFSTVLVTGRAVTVEGPVVQLTNIAPAVIYRNEKTALATVVGLPTDPYEDISADVEWAGPPGSGEISYYGDPIDGSTGLGIIEPTTSGASVISIYALQPTVPLTMTFTLTLRIHDHVEAWKDTVLGVISGTIQVPNMPNLIV
jgi:hypothetical protein